MLMRNRTSKCGLGGRRAAAILAILLFGIVPMIAGCGAEKPTTYVVSGRVTLNGDGLPGVTLAFSGMSTTATTDAQGNWTQSGLSGTATVTPAKIGYTFDPASIAVSGERTDVNFTALTPPPVPSGLTAVGSLGQIQLTWNASASATGYNVYRGTSEGTLVKVTAAPIASTSYTDTIPSPAGDGVWYYYKVTAVAGPAESGFSSLVRSMHGTRLNAVYSTGYNTEPFKSPYVAEGTVTVNGGNLQVADGTRLYVLDNSTIDIEAGNTFLIAGYLRVVASSGAQHATFTAHKAGGGVPDNTTGLRLNFSGSDSGSLVQNTLIDYLAQGKSLTIGANAAVELRNSHFAYRGTLGGVYMTFEEGAGPVIDHCRFDGVALRLGVDLRSTGFSMANNIMRGGFGSYSVYFENLLVPGVSVDQISQNDLDGTKTAYLSSMTGTEDVPLRNNYWNAGTGNPPLPPTGKYDSAKVDFDFSGALSSAPFGVGPNW